MNTVTATGSQVGLMIAPEQASIELLYAYGMLILPDMWELCGGNVSNLYEFHARFGQPWRRDDYRVSLEYDALLPRVAITSYIDGAFTKLADNHHEIPWHSD